LHKLHKLTVAQELQKQSYGIYYEPWESPLDLLWWQAYKPDILAIKQTNSDRRIVLVECETKPNRKRVLNKTRQIKENLELQNQLFKNTMILPLLIIPPNNLQKIVFSQIRKFWEIWIINQEGEIKHKIPRNPGPGSWGSFDLQ
jgi:hypothetical protein